MSWKCPAYHCAFTCLVNYQLFFCCQVNNQQISRKKIYSVALKAKIKVKAPGAFGLLIHFFCQKLGLWVLPPQEVSFIFVACTSICIGVDRIKQGEGHLIFQAFFPFWSLFPKVKVNIFEISFFLIRGGSQTEVISSIILQ